jgi:hypothetical protein
MDAIARAFEVYVQGDGEDRQLQAAIDWLTK